MLSPTQGLSLFGGGIWLSCHTEILLADFILTIRCCKWQPIYPFKCITHKTYFLKQKPSDPPSCNKISNQPTTHILHRKRSSFWGRHGVLLWVCIWRHSDTWRDVEHVFAKKSLLLTFEIPFFEVNDLDSFKIDIISIIRGAMQKSNLWTRQHQRLPGVHVARLVITLSCMMRKDTTNGRHVLHLQ